MKRLTALTLFVGVEQPAADCPRQRIHYQDDLWLIAKEVRA
jgi:hypothetical protein